MPMRALTLIFLNDGIDDGFYWIALDGDEDSLRPSAIIAAFPDLLASAATVTGYEDRRAVPLSVVRASIGSSPVCLAETSFETRLFTRDPILHQRLLERLKTCLPELDDL